ncbi:PLP-dependent cysteine synthase family protein [Lacisediminihabitans profunda]|uniref:PLP-dependent cysteine synthase family protein n=1 Tax=Lacisediminihabitans profunda TaxID=2594790 RepID=A0A5C8UNN2_9MICO|nr:PLP-dependent cysteine synthase family protein [Lacisediminihabitans profunda]TXN30005.1 PLP-dependent cysteine synthase family protein [Lacisediminihabitans profunda]
MRSETHTWVLESIRKLEAEANSTPETPLHLFPLPADWEIDLYLKNESVQPTGSLKHRLAHSLLLHALVNGDLTPTTTLVEASSGSTAVSEAYFARLLGLDFVAVVPASTSRSKLALIEQYGGRCELVADPHTVYAEAERLAAPPGWFYLDQFSNASSATDWRGSTNIAHSIFAQLRLDRYPEPTWIVVGAGTGGTSAAIGRHCRYRGARTKVAVVDPEGSAFYRAWAEHRRDITAVGSRIEGIGRPRVEPSFIPGAIDEVVQVPDAGSIAAMRLLAETTGLRAGPSTGTNLYGALLLIARMLAAGETGSVVTVICDSGDRYLDTYYSDEWVAAEEFDLAPHTAMLAEALRTGRWESETANSAGAGR